MNFFIVTLVLLFALRTVSKMLLIVSQREYVIKERLGKFQSVLGPGFHFMLPILDRSAYRDELREQVIDVPSQNCITRDNIQVEVDGVVYLKVIDPFKASYKIGNYRLAAINLAQTTMRSEIGKITLDETFSERDHINDNIVTEIDKASEAWGVKVIRYEIMNISPSRHVIDTMEKQMEAERAKRADITISEGQKQAQIQLSQGQRQESVNISEGERQRRINEATGRAEEIRLLAYAQAEGVRLIAEAFQAPGGHMALRNQLVEQYLEEFGRVMHNTRVSVVPTELARMRGFFEGITQVGSATGEPPAAPPATPPARK
jgi:regulator of protease activity HflC (stomatin/prohibitin superfamily)